MLAGLGWGLSQWVKSSSSASEPTAEVLERISAVAKTDAMKQDGQEELHSAEGKELQEFFRQFSTATQKKDANWINQHISIRGMLEAAAVRNPELARHVRGMMMMGIIIEPIMRREFGAGWENEEHHSYRLRSVRLNASRDVAEVYLAEHDKSGSYEKQRYWLAKVEQGGWAFFEMEHYIHALRMTDPMVFAMMEEEGTYSARKVRKHYQDLMDAEDVESAVKSADLVLGSTLPGPKKGVAALSAVAFLMMEGDAKRTTHYLQAAQRYLPQHPTLHEQWTRLHYQEQRYAEALKSYARYEELRGLDPELCAIAISCHTELKDTAAANAALRKGLAQYPDDSSLLARLPGDYSQQEALKLLSTGFAMAIHAESDFDYMASFFEEDQSQMFLLKHLVGLMKKRQPDYEDLMDYEATLLAHALREAEPDSEKALKEFFSTGDMEDRLSSLSYELTELEDEALLEQVLAAYQKTPQANAQEVDTARWDFISSHWREKMKKSPLTEVLRPFLKDPKLARSRVLFLVDDLEGKEGQFFTQLGQCYAELQPQDKTVQPALEARYALAVQKAQEPDLNSTHYMTSVLEAAPDAEAKARDILKQAVLAESSFWLWVLKGAAEDLKLSPAFIKEVESQGERLNQAE
jgi:hypothetical protein